MLLFFVAISADIDDSDDNDNLCVARWDYCIVLLPLCCRPFPKLMIRQ